MSVLAGRRDSKILNAFKNSDGARKMSLFHAWILAYEFPAFGKERFRFLVFERLRLVTLPDGDKVVSAMLSSLLDDGAIRRGTRRRSGDYLLAQPRFLGADAGIVGGHEARERAFHGRIDIRFHLPETAEAFAAVLDKRVALAVRPERYGAAQVVHGLELLEPERVDYLEQQAAQY